MSDKIINIDNLKHYNDKINQTKQDILISGQNIKTINGESIVGSGDIVIENGTYILEWDGSESGTITQDQWDALQSADNILIEADGAIFTPVIFSKTENDIIIAVSMMAQSSITISITINSDLSYQAALLESTFIESGGLKTINGESLEGIGNIEISGGNPDANVSAVDTSETLDDVDGNTYVKYVAQTLTEEQKAQARTNIDAVSQNNIKTVNGQSLLGDGDIITSEREITLTHNAGQSCLLEPGYKTMITNILEGPLYVQFSNPISNGYTKEGGITFTTGSTAPTVIFNGDIWWVNGIAPTIDANTVYEFSFKFNLASYTWLGVYASFKTV